jgi:hypothetical protein
MSSSGWVYHDTAIRPSWRLDIANKAIAWAFHDVVGWRWIVTIKSSKVRSNCFISGLTEGWANSKEEAMREAEEVLEMIEEY